MNYGPSDFVELSNGSIVAGGYFNSYSGIPVGYICKLTTGATLDNSFNTGLTGFNGYVNKLSLQSTGKIIVGGEFT